ncbi:hypothetical protein [Hyalangium rubrum]|uniref:TIGR02270 family protein n=1 Tax=Hyalangium rubrum TaxID=3103134 RepID=A0ABU5HD18_9BACT|nr:hypothetical protein [Hyalangium sp. s54d21]MDY7231165.1 hypothetical protein [Hyalangium sp. s54d21]
MSGRVGIQTVQALLDEALLGLRAVADPALPVRQAEEQLALALREVYEASAARGDWATQRESLKAMAAHLHMAATLLAQVPTADPGGIAELDLIQQAMKAAIRAVGEPLAEDEARPEERAGVREPVRASLREPRLLDPEREVLLPAIPLPELPEPEASPPPAPEAPPPVTTPAQLDALLAAAQARLAAFEAAGEDTPKEAPAEEDRPAATDDEALHFHFGTAKQEQEVLLGHARTCMEDLGMFGLMRRPHPLTAWWNGERTERRLVRRVDAIVACGPQVLPRLVKMLEERPEPDPELTWANLFLFGSLAGQDALDQALRIIRTVELDDPKMAEAVTDALALAPHPGIEGAVRPWLAAEGVARRAIGLRVLARRGALSAAEAIRGLEDPELEVVRAASQGLGTTQGDAPHEALTYALRHEDEEVVRAALESALLRRSETGLERAYALTQEGRGGFADAALFLAVASDENGAEAFRAALAAGGAPTVLRALGWFGSLEFMDALLKHLAGEEPEAKAAALEALQRLTGASLTEDLPDPEYPREAQPFLRAFEPPRLVPDLTDKAPIWSAWWSKHDRNAKAGTRYRFGHVWSPRISLWELESQDALPAQRRLAHVELAVRTGGAIPLDRGDFVARQLTQLEAWKTHVEAGARRSKADGWATRYAR